MTKVVFSGPVRSTSLDVKGMAEVCLAPPKSGAIICRTNMRYEPKQNFLKWKVFSVMQKEGGE